MGVDPPQLHHRSLDLDRHLMRTRLGAMRPVLQPVDPVSLVAAQPPVQRLTSHPVPGRHLGHRPSLIQDFEHRLQSLFHNPEHHQRHADLPDSTHNGQASGNRCHQSTESNVTDQPQQVSHLNRHDVTHQPNTQCPLSTELVHPHTSSHWLTPGVIGLSRIRTGRPAVGASASSSYGVVRNV